MKNALLNGKKVLLAVIEGYRADAAAHSGFQMCCNKDEWYSYAGMAQYLLLTSGKTFYETPYPPVYNRTKKKRETVYPFSGFFVSIPADTLGDLPGIRSAVVSSRSMIVHMAANADLAIECYCRDKSNYGTMAAIKQALGVHLPDCVSGIRKSYSSNLDNYFYMLSFVLLFSTCLSPLAA